MTGTAGLTRYAAAARERANSATTAAGSFSQNHINVVLHASCFDLQDTVLVDILMAMEGPELRLLQACYLTTDYNTAQH
jgi:hypothetical protein